MRDVGFYALVKEDKQVAEKIIDEINWMKNSIDFNSRSVFGVIGIDKIDAWGRAPGMSKSIYAYQYISTYH